MGGNIIEVEGYGEVANESHFKLRVHI